MAAKQTMLWLAALTCGCIGVNPPKKSTPLVADVALGEPLMVEVNGRGPFPFGIDTGQSVSVLVTPDLAARLALPIVDHIHASDGVRSKPADVVRIDAVELDGLERANQLGLVTMPGDVAFDGALGMQFFDGVLVVFDGPAKRLRIERGALPEPDGRRVLPVRLDRDLPLVKITIGGRDVEALLDTGSAGGLLIPMDMSASLPLESPPARSGRVSTLAGEFDVFSARLDGSVTIGEIEIDHPQLAFSSYFQEINMGRDFLRDFIVTFDVGSSRVRFERETVPPKSRTSESATTEHAHSNER
jgi:predicted aspartyl protease